MKNTILLCAALAALSACQSHGPERAVPPPEAASPPLAAAPVAAPRGAAPLASVPPVTPGSTPLESPVGPAASTAAPPSMPREGCDAFVAEPVDIQPPIRDAEIHDAERVARRFYTKFILRRRIDNRLPARHPMMTDWEGVAGGHDARKCALKYADILIFGAPKTLSLDAHYHWVRLSFNDAADGEMEYIIFVERATLKVASVLQELNFP